MSNINKETINKVAKLANIKVNDEEKEQLCSDLTKITNFIELLNEVNTDNVEILNNVHNSTLELFADEVKQDNDIEDILKNAPDSKYNYFAVPKVIE